MHTLIAETEVWDGNTEIANMELLYVYRASTHSLFSTCSHATDAIDHGEETPISCSGFEHRSTVFTVLVSISFLNRRDKGNHTTERAYELNAIVVAAVIAGAGATTAAVVSPQYAQ